MTFGLLCTAGQEKFKSLTPMYYRDCAAALVVYDLSKPDTLETAQYWTQELREKEDPHVIILVGNKSDMVDNLDEVSKAGQAYADEMGLKYFVASAKTGDNVREIFTHLVSKLPVQESVAPSNDVNVVNVASQRSNSQQQSDCPC